MPFPLLVPLIAAGLQAGAGYAAAKSKEQEAKRRELLNSQNSALDTAFSPFNKTTSSRLEVGDAGPGALGGALSGAVSGFSTGMNINKGLAGPATASTSAGLSQPPMSTLPGTESFGQNPGYMPTPGSPYQAAGGYQVPDFGGNPWSLAKKKSQFASGLLDGSGSTRG